MPFSTESRDTYELGVKEVAKRLGFATERADEIEHNQEFLHVIVERIKSSTVVVAETTGWNPNVFYEIGYGHALRKPTILLSRRGQDIPANLRAFNCLVYDDIVDLRYKLEKRLRAIPA